MAKLCFIDTETTSLRHDRRTWEIGIIARSEDGTPDTEHHWYIDASYLDLGNADLKSLEIGRFYERHPQYRLDRASGDIGTVTEYDALRLVEAITRGAHLVGAVVSFDADVLGQRMRASGICPSWHYHLIDVEALGAGYLASMAHGLVGIDPLHLPWDSLALSAALGVVVSDEDRHTALGDARWAKAIYDVVVARS